MRIILIVFLGLASFFISVSTALYAHAENAAPPDFSPLAFDTVLQPAGIIDPLRIRFTDGRIVHLAGLYVPDLTPYDPGENGLKIMAWLEESTKNKQIRIYHSKDRDKGRKNRMGNQIAHLQIRDSEIWIQAYILEQGWARFLPDPDQAAMAPQMIAIEDKARAQGAGLWADKTLLYTPETVKTVRDRWAIVEGRIYSSAMVNNVTYLNFEPDWRTDFTIGIPAPIRRLLGQQGVNLQNLSGRKIRVRGWVDDYNGPYIELTHTLWLELLPEDP